ncbi:iron-sulfur cluster assembly protein [uncultured Porphyromonas sp.]|uniref:metal-sulfur cluster assembly factor n=1 Tax=uncultured Porphyromonas sp. TaxID=159274 RepID=UPI00262E40F7|nr:iron-sulfur cluster assembly protein [uncultured Porphyromonas sp.]
MENNLMQMEEEIVKALRTVYDPEIPVNIYDLGLVYDVDVNHETGHVVVTMTLTSPNCPVVDFLITDVQMRVESVKGVKSAEVKITFDPEWHRDMMTDEAKLELGLL